MQRAQVRRFDRKPESSRGSMLKAREVLVDGLDFP